MASLKIAEQMLFERLENDAEDYEIPMLFILGSPRTGTTLAYQFIINVFGFYYFSNFVAEQFAKHPAVGVAIDIHVHPKKPVSFSSNYGKTTGLFEPSEASWIFKNWFGGKQPSQTKSAKVLAGKETHMKMTLRVIHKIAGLPLATKNAWNCFRIEDICRMFPGIRFLWLRRDVVRSAISDLEARYRRGDPEGWNSATTKNYKEIQKLPYWEQVVEQQFEYNRTLQDDLRKYCTDGFLELWYEDLCTDTNAVARKLHQAFSSWGWKVKKPENMRIRQFNTSPGPSGMQKDIRKITDYVAEDPLRFGPYYYKR